MRVPFFRVGEDKVWGATAMILSEFVERLRHVRDSREIAPARVWECAAPQD